MTKTLFLFIDYQDKDDVFFFEKEGDYSYLADTYINLGDDLKKEDELGEILWGEDYEIMLKELKFIVDKLKMPTKDWDYFVKTGIY